MNPEENNENNQEELAETKPEEPLTETESFKNKLQAFVRPLYMKMILSTLTLILVVWGVISTCSSPSEMSKHRYLIGLDPTWGPLELGNRENRLTAFCETILYDIAKKLDMRIAIHHTTSTEQLFNEFEKGNYEGIVSMMLPPAPRHGIAPLYITSNPLYRLGPVLIIDKESSFNTLQEMSGRVVALVGDARVDVNIGQYPNVIFSGYSNVSNAFADLNNHKIDGLITDSLLAKNFVHGLYADKLRIADFSLTNEGIVLILHKTNSTQKFIEQFNQELKRLRDDGTFAALLKTWNVQEE